MIETIADSDANVLITGESGTGKELLAKSIHLNSSRGHHPYVYVNCAGESEEMLEVEMFGRESLEENHRVGRFELAHKGTLFLDDLNALSMRLQAKLLRVLEIGVFERVGGETQVEVDVRVYRSGDGEPARESPKRSVSKRPVLSPECYSNLFAAAAGTA